MIKKVFRPFWSFNFIKTEKWLSKMAMNGYKIINFNLISKVFTFEKGNGKKVNYKIHHHKAGINPLSQSLIKSGWCNVVSKGTWTILENENDESAIKMYPSREDMLKRNRNIKVVVGLILTAYLISFIPSFLIITMAFHYFNIYTYISPALIISVLTYIIVKLNNSDKKIRMENTIGLNSDSIISVDRIISSEDEKSLRKEGRIIKKIKLAWLYAPDKIEQWVENMEADGYNLYKINKLGNTFNFIKGTPRKIKCFVDYQGSVSDSYYEIHKLNGWKMMFTSMTALTISRYTLWLKEYTDEKPEFYSDKNQILKNARNQCLLYSLIFIPLILLYIKTIISMINMRLSGATFVGLTPILIALVIIEFGYFTIMSIGYYVRTKKKVNSQSS